MLNRIADMVEGVADTLGSIFKTSLPSYCDIETADSENALVTKRGTMVSGIRIHGVKDCVGPAEFEQIVSSLTSALQSFLTHSGQSIDFFNTCDSAGIRKVLNREAEGMRKSCENVGLDINDVISANVAEMAKYTAEEYVCIAIWSRPTLLSKQEMRDGLNAIRKASLKVPAIPRSAQSPFSTIPSLRERHEATTRSIMEDLKNAGINATLMTSHEMLRTARMEIDPGFTPQDWKPTLLGDTLPVLKSSAALRNEGAKELTIDDLQMPSVARQIFPRDAYRLNAKYVVVGDRAYAPVFIEIPSKDITPFSALFEKLRSAQVPWRAMFRIDGGGLKFTGTKDMIATILSITSGTNRRISDAITHLKHLENENATSVRVRMSFCTWAPESNVELLTRRAARLAQTITSWGGAEVREFSGDSMHGFMSTVPFVTETSAATACTAPLDEILRTIGIMRPASPWPTGTMSFRSLDGKLMPFTPGSSAQTTWNYIFFGRPGRGKSVQMLNMLLASCLAPGLSKLPRMGILDIGPSSMYFIEMLKGCLPASMQHLVQGFKLSMTKEHAINPCDTFAGCRKPTPEQKSMIVSIVSQLATPAEALTPYPRMSELISKAVDDAYEMYSDVGSTSTPKRYRPEVELKVDAKLRQLNFGSDRETTWWEVTDFLFSKGYKHESSLAQRHAVPQITDLVVLSKQVCDMYENITTPSGETLPQAFKSLMASALQDFPNLASHTSFDIGNVRIAAINLEEVAKASSAAADRQTAIMYMLANFALTKDYRLDEDTAKKMVAPPMYREEHLATALSNKEEKKWIAWDEFHRPAKSKSAVDTVMVDLREGRKYGICVVLSSQGAEDFPPEMREFASGTFIIDAGSDKNARKLQEFFGFNDTARELMSKHCTGPKSYGVPFLAVFDTKEHGQVVQLLVSTVGIETRWALSTTSEDALVRRNVCESLGATEGRMALAAVYPNGAQSAVERLKARGETDAVEQIVKDTLLRWTQRKAAEAVARKAVVVPNRVAEMA